MDDKKTKLALANAEDYGYMMAQLNLAFASWVEKKRHFNAKVSMRSGHPIMHAAEYLGKRGKAKFEEWDEMWLNRSATCNLYTHCAHVRQYIPEKGLDKPFTLVDNGYGGTLSKFLISSFDNRDLQTLLLLADGRFRGSEKQKAFIEYNNHELADRIQELVEDMPQEYERFDEENYVKNTQGKIVVDKVRTGPNCQDKFRSFHIGLEKGFEDCFDAVQSGDKAQLEKYTNTLLVSPAGFTLSHNGEDFFPSSKLTKHKQKIKKIYEKG